MKITAMMAMLLAGCGSGGVDGPTLVGPEGPQGPPGPQGERGPAGAPGMNVSAPAPHLILVATGEDLGPTIGPSASFYPPASAPVRWTYQAEMVFDGDGCTGNRAIAIVPEFDVKANEAMIDVGNATLVKTGKVVVSFVPKSFGYMGACAPGNGIGNESVSYYEPIDLLIPAQRHFSLETAIELR